jgi:CRP-like cAMP-binding protein
MPAFFDGLSPGERETVMRRAVSRQAERKQVIFHEGDAANALYLVDAGRVKLTQLAADGQEVLVRFAGPGEVIAAVAALPGSKYPVTAAAVEPTRLLLWHSADIEDLCGRYPRLRTNLLQAVSGHMRDALGRVRELATERVAQRVARTLLRLTRQAGRRVEGGVLIDHPLSRQELAEMTGTTLYTVSRLLSQWEGEGIVEAGRERVLVRHPHRLVAIAEDLAGRTEEQ